ncbi:MAG: alkaline phosphatase PhoX [Rhodothermales bacterium]
MNTVSRRHFIKSSAAFASGIAGLHRFAAAAVRLDGYGPLVPDPAGVFDLPEGFSYRIISRAGETMSDGFILPAVPDGMATFPYRGSQMILLRNHEVNVGAPGASGPFGAGNELLSLAEHVYDKGQALGPCLGGTTTLVYDTKEQRVVSQHLSLTGTLRNCAGGSTPWGTWLTCEESTVRTGTFAARDHGYVFEVPASPEMKLAEPVPLRAMGRFNHEAVAVDPHSGIVYETEDQGDSLLYRFIPDEQGRLAEGGRLQALAVAGRPVLDTRNWDEVRVHVGEGFDVRWIDLDDVDTAEDDLRFRGFLRGAARFARGEGMWYGNGAVYFACTNGGPARAGQIWRYVPSPDEGKEGEGENPGRLELFIEPNDIALLQNCDNVTVAPWGDLIMCEDGPGEQFLVGVTTDGLLYKLGRNAISGSELTGATFSPDGTTLFTNIQGHGLTLAITGPWDRR